MRWKRVAFKKTRGDHDRSSPPPVPRRDQRDPVGGRGAGAAGDLHGDGPDALPWYGHHAAPVGDQYDQARAAGGAHGRAGSPRLYRQGSGPPGLAPAETGRAAAQRPRGFGVSPGRSVGSLRDGGAGHGQRQEGGHYKTGYGNRPAESS